MPRRGQTHKVDDQARTAVEKVLAAGGLATEVVHKDYGEDLLVQVSIGDAVQPARCWIQVKGTRDSSRMSRKDGTYAVAVKTSHLLRWARSADPVLLVLWDVSTDCGWWVAPRSQVDQYELYLKSRVTKVLRIPGDQPLDKDSVSSLAWKITLEHFTNLIVQANASQIVAAEIAAMDDQSDVGAKVAGRGATVLAFDVLRLLGVITTDGLSEDIFQMVQNGVNNLARDPDFIQEEVDLLESAAILALLGTADKRGGIGLPHLLLQELTATFVSLLRGTDIQLPDLS